MPSPTPQLQRLLDIMEKLRSPDGCPWDREQTHQSIRHNLIEECYETIEALDSGNPDEFRDELGDLLLQVVFHAQMAREAGQFDFEAVAQSIADKLVRRHPHVFGDARAADSAAVLQQWEEIKKREKKSEASAPDAPPSIFDELTQTLPALLKADKVQRKASRVGFDWKKSGDVLAKVEEELDELKAAIATGNRQQFEEELGDLLFAATNLARFENLHAEEILNRTTAKFIDRFKAVERAVHASGKRLEDCTLEELDSYWEQAKNSETARTNSVGD